MSTTSRLRSNPNRPRRRAFHVSAHGDPTVVSHVRRANRKYSSGRQFPAAGITHPHTAKSEFHDCSFSRLNTSWQKGCLFNQLRPPEVACWEATRAPQTPAPLPLPIGERVGVRALLHYREPLNRHPNALLTKRELTELVSRSLARISHLVRKPSTRMLNALDLHDEDRGGNPT
jgi:hypothetical protein